MSGVKVVMTGRSYKTKAGTVREVDADTAKQLVADGLATKQPTTKDKKD